MKRRKTVALLGKTLIDWGGGIDILRLFAQALALQQEEQNLQLCLLLPGNDFFTRVTNVARPYKDIFRQLARLEKPARSRTAPFDMTAVTDVFRNIDGLRIVFFRNSAAVQVKCLQEIGADVVLPSIGSLGREFPVPWVGYIPDLQHRHHPEFFATSECAKRDRVYARLLQEAKSVIVNSRAAEADIAAFFPAAGSRIVPLPFAPVPDDAWFEADRQDVAGKYGLPADYFAICNQFWIHKSHGTAFEALALLQKCSGGHDIHLVCTGQTTDVRFPGYFEQLREQVRQLGIEDRVHFLGHIPKIDQIHVVRGARAVIQPTLFEGGPGGGAVYDAVALGVPAIASDIPVNREIVESGVTFFTAGSAEKLAERMADLLGVAREEPNVAELIRRGKERAARLGESLLEAVSSV